MKALILDLGLGNLLSIRRGLERAGAEVDLASAGISDDQRPLERAASGADAIVLPGVGAFGDGVAATKRFGPVLDLIKAGEKPLLGICLGMQLLFEKSSEGGEHVGLGMIRGEVVRLPQGVKVPHMGWNSVEKNKESSLMAGVQGGEYFYFVHSYYCKAPREAVVAECEYGMKIPAALEWQNVFGTQFHPEKSGAAGVAVLKNFLEAVKR
jgi:glutamine amidotransferase